MKRFINLLAALALVVSMQGCGSGPATEPEIPENPDSPTQASVQLRLKGDIAAIKPASRVGASGFEADDKVGVYVSATGSLSTSSNMLDNEAFTYSSGNITAPEGKEVYWGTPETRLSVWAYYPYTESVSNNAAYPFAVAVDQSEPEGFYNSDFILAKATNLEPQSDAVNLTFNHSLSKIFITLEAGTGITDEELAEAEKSFSIKGLVTDGTIDLATGTATAGTTTATITPLESEDVNYEAIVYPQQGAVTFRMEMDGDIYTYTTDVDFEAALQYDYTLTINVREPQEMSLKTTTITPWGEGESHEGTMTDIITFTDPKFKAYLLNEVIYEETENTYVATDKKIDANNDGEISIAEAERVECIYAPGLGISNMSELHYFPNLKYLSCSYNELTSLDVSKNTALEVLYCGKNQLNSLDVSNNTALVQLWCIYNQLTSLDVSKNTALGMLDCHNNQLTSLDVSKNTALMLLYCDSNQLNSLDVSKNTALVGLYCDGNQLNSLDVSKNTALGVLCCYSNQLTALDVSKNTALRSLRCYNNQLTALDVSNNTALTQLHCNNNQLTSLDVSNNTALEDLDCGGNQLTSLDLSNNTALVQLYCYHNQLTALDVSNNTALEDLSCGDNQLTSLDVSNNTALEELSCGRNQLTTLDMSNNTALERLYCYYNQLTSLDVSNNTALVLLSCNPMNDENGNNLLTTLYIAEGQTIADFYKPDQTTIEHKQN